LRVNPVDTLVVVIIVGKVSRESVGEELLAGVNLVHADFIGNDDRVSLGVGDIGDVNIASNLAFRSPRVDGTVNGIIRRS